MSRFSVGLIACACCVSMQSMASESLSRDVFCHDGVRIKVQQELSADPAVKAVQKRRFSDLVSDLNEATYRLLSILCQQKIKTIMLADSCYTKEINDDGLEYYFKFESGFMRQSYFNSKIDRVIAEERDRLRPILNREDNNVLRVCSPFVVRIFRRKTYLLSESAVRVLNGEAFYAITAFERDLESAVTKWIIEKKAELEKDDEKAREIYPVRTYLVEQDLLKFFKMAETKKAMLPD